MENWYHKNLHGTELVLLSESGYINDKLAMDWLRHFIVHTQSTETSKPKALLLDSHTSHHHPPFAILAEKYNIYPFTFPSHLTHILQPLDVGIFQPYKHWHKVAVQTAIRSLDLQYDLSSFLRNLPTIRANTFKPQTIIHAFRKAGMWPVNSTVSLQKIQKYSKPTDSQENEAQQLLPTLKNSENQLQVWKDKFTPLLSSPSKHQFHTSIKGMEEVLVDAQIREFDFSMLQGQVQQSQNRKSRSHRTLQLGGALTATHAHAKIQQKARKEVDKQEKQIARIAKAEASQAKKALHQAGVEAQRKERERKKEVTRLTRANEFIPIELLTPIVDPEAQAKAQAEGVVGQIEVLDMAGDDNDGVDESDGESVIFTL